MNGRWVAFGLCLWLFPFSIDAQELDMPLADEATDYLSPKTMAEAHPQWQPAIGQAGAAWGGFLEWPALSAALLIDSNPLQVHAPRSADIGVRLTPRFVAEREDGVHSTAAYGVADARFYSSASGANQLEGRVGVLHDWAPLRDFIIRLQGDVSRSRDRIDSRQVVTGRAGGTPFDVQNASVSASAQKSFQRLFVALSTTVERSSFEDSKAVRTTSGYVALSSQTAVTVKARAGYWLGPSIFTFAQPAANWRVLDAVDQHSSGVRVIAGIGTDRISLIGGEVYAGFQRQAFSRTSSAVSEPLVGGRLAWWPSRAWTVSAHFDRGLEQAAVGTVAEPLGTPIDVQTERLSLRYAPAAPWWVESGLERDALDYIATRRRDRLYSLDATFGYAYRHDLDFTADLRLTRVESTTALAAYRRAIATIGAVYRY